MGYPQAPGYPAQPGYGTPAYQPAPAYGQPPAPGYSQPPAAYGPPPGYGQAPPQQPMPKVGADDFLNQPAAGEGKSIAGWFKTPGQWLQARIPREIDPAIDTRVQTKYQSQEIDRYKDGTPKTTLTIPLQLIAPEPIPADFDNGRAVWIVSITDYRNEILPAMEAAGVPRSPNGNMPFPEKDAVLTVTYEGPKQIQQQGAPKKVKHCAYYRPPGYAPGQPTAMQAAAQGQPAAAQASAPQAPAPAPVPAQPPAYAPQATAPAPTYPAPPQPAAPQYAQPTPPVPPQAPQLPTAPGAPPYQGAPPAPMAQPQYQGPAAPVQAAPAPAPAGPAPLSPDKNELFGQLQQGQAQPAPATAPQAPTA